MESLKIHAHSEDGVYHIEVIGEVDVSCASELRDALNEAFEQEAKAVALHMDELSYIDSTGIGVLVAAAQRAHEMDVALSLVNPQRNVARVLALLGVDEELNVTMTPDEE